MDDLLISRIHDFVLSFISVFCNIIGEGLLKVLGVFPAVCAGVSMF